MLVSRPNATPALMVALLIGYAVTGCAAARPGAMSGGSPNLITLPELTGAQRDGIRDLYELIDRTRPRWLQGRTPRSLQLPTVIAVYHHETLLGGVDVLRGYPLISVTSVRYLDAAQAMLLPGAGSTHVEGAIVISTALVPDTGSVRPPIRPFEGGV